VSDKLKAELLMGLTHEQFLLDMLYGIESSSVQTASCVNSLMQEQRARKLRDAEKQQQQQRQQQQQQHGSDRLQLLLAASQWSSQPRSMAAVAHDAAPTGRTDVAAAASDTVASARANTAQSSHSAHSTTGAASQSEGNYVQTDFLMQAVFGGTYSAYSGLAGLEPQLLRATAGSATAAADGRGNDFMPTSAAATDTDHHVAAKGALELLSDMAAERTAIAAAIPGPHTAAHSTAAAAAAAAAAAGGTAAAVAVGTAAAAAASSASVRWHSAIQRADGVAAVRFNTSAASTAATYKQHTAAYSNAAAAAAGGTNGLSTRSAMQQGDEVPSMLINNYDAWQQGGSSTVTTHTGSVNSGYVARSSAAQHYNSAAAAMQSTRLGASRHASDSVTSSSAGAVTSAAAARGATGVKASPAALWNLVNNAIEPVSSTIDAVQAQLSTAAANTGTGTIGARDDGMTSTTAAATGDDDTFLNDFIERLLAPS
jgi:trimeric autotransporter adhesin